MINPTLAPRSWTNALVATVVPWSTVSQPPSSWLASSPRISATLPTAAMNPFSKFGGVDGLFVAVTVPSSSRWTMSVNVPPMSTPR